MTYSNLSHNLNLEGAQILAAGALHAAQQMGIPVWIATMDTAGNIILLQRMDKAPIHSEAIARAKAMSAVAKGIPTSGIIQDLRLNIAAGITNLAGGMPIILNSKIGIIGSIGISGATNPDDDEIIARESIYALKSKYR
jgi:glc operon protein GlcG